MTAIAYPSAIARACSALDEVPVFRDLPDGYIRVVVRIVKKINLSKLNAPIVASRGTIAEESGKSVETVGRVVKWLEERGLIQRTQKARAGLRGSSSPLVPTRQLLDALLLTTPPAGAAAPKKSASKAPDLAAPPSDAPETCPQGSGVSPDGSKSMPPKQPEGIQPRNGAFTRIDSVSIPTDLVWLVSDQGLKATGVLALMALAKAAKQRLSDVVATTRQYLLKLRGRELFAYLRALISRDRDYGYLVREDQKKQQEELKLQRVAEKRITLAGRRFQSRDGKTIIFVENGGILTEMREGRRYARPLDYEFLEALDAGRVVPHRAWSDDDGE